MKVSARLGWTRTLVLGGCVVAWPCVAALGQPPGNRAGRQPPGQQPGRQPRAMPKDLAPEVGAEAPTFKLKLYDNPKKEVDLASFRGKKPVVLIFGSYT